MVNFRVILDKLYFGSIVTIQSQTTKKAIALVHLKLACRKTT
ncbi:MAG TPA: hypothetical protein V6D18_01540 [Thermosynechococcaceae cyanobacterium]